LDDNQQYPVDFLQQYHVHLLHQCTPCELHKPFSNITMKV
jgi:hypothetical protein